MSLKEPLYVAFPFGAGLAYAPHAGDMVSPAPRTYKTPAAAQLANPTGRLYVCEMSDNSDTLNVVARLDAYPLELQEFRVPGIGATAEGAVVLRDMGPRTDHRWVTHFRNDQSGGYHGGSYFDDFSKAVAAFAEDAAREARMAVARFAKEPAEA